MRQWLAGAWQWLAAVPGWVAAALQAIKYGVVATAGWVARGWHDQAKSSRSTLEAAAKFDAVRRTLRIDPAFGERLRRESGKPDK